MVATNLGAQLLSSSFLLPGLLRGSLVFVGFSVGFGAGPDDLALPRELRPSGWGRGGGRRRRGWSVGHDLGGEQHAIGQAVTLRRRTLAHRDIAGGGDTGSELTGRPAICQRPVAVPTASTAPFAVAVGNDAAGVAGSAAPTVIRVAARTPSGCRRPSARTVEPICDFAADLRPADRHQGRAKSSQ
ncbi:MAG: hypothetical protein U0232_18945 [Thermomicrobiales bacterium]